jgi:hypothetical protein
MDLQDTISLTILAAGAILAGGGLLGMLRSSLWRGSHTDADARPPAQVRESEAFRGPAPWLAGLLVLVALGMGFEGIEHRGMSHVEVYVPNIELPAEISEPPERSALGDVLWWHWHFEPHPQGYYVGMWAWTKAFGTSLVALRTPTILLGGLAVWLVFLVGTRAYGVRAGLIAAALLAFNGHHVYWMQNARMYGPSLAVGLLSLWLWLRLLERDRLPRGESAAYVVVTALGTWLQVYFWPFIAGQMAWTAFGRRRREPHPVLGLQTLAVILGTPMWAHAVYRAYAQPQNATTFSFVQDFFNFGFLFQPEDWSLTPRDVAVPVEWVATALAAVVLYFYLRRPRSGNWQPAAVPETPAALSLRALAPVALGLALVLLALGREAFRRQTGVMLTAAVPLAAWAHLAAWRAFARSRAGSVEPTGTPVRAWDPVAFALAVSAGLVFALGLAVSFLVSRGMLVLVPLLLLVFAAGMDQLWRRSRAAGVAALALALALGSWSVVYYRGIPDPNDYRGIASAMLERMEPQDRIFVPSGDWVTTPVFYHLNGHFDRLVGRDWSTVAEDAEVERVWTLRFSDIPMDPGIAAALVGFEAVDSVAIHREVAVLHHRRGPGAAP